MQWKKKCKVCKDKFSPWNSLTRTCSPICAIQDGRDQQAKKDRKELREGRDRLKTRSNWLREAQTVFNRYIRTRDDGNVCISCQTPPKKKNAGHYRSVGAAPELRFNEKNCHLQCEYCNTYNSGNAIEYRINLVKLIGVEEVESLEGLHEPKKYTIEEIKEIKAKYSKMARDLEFSR